VVIAAPAPPFSRETSRTRGSQDRAISAVRSVEPSSTTTISAGATVCRTMDPMASAIVASALKAGMTAE